jgi:hypothetical protein
LKCIDELKINPENRIQKAGLGAKRRRWI